MYNINKCLREIEKVKKVAVGADVAYAARSRIARLILNVMRLIAAEVGLYLPDRPTRIEVSDSMSHEVRVLAEICNRLSDTATTVCQPSEPLDERWRSGWTEILTEISELEDQLHAIRKNG